MAGQRQPIALVQAKGKKHLTKAEIAEREQTEVKAPSDRVTPPSYLTKQPLMVTAAYDTGKKDAEGYPIMAEHEVVNSQVERLAIIQDRYFKQCRQGAADFGLTVSSRCRLIIPKAPEAPKTNKFKDKFA